jgi:hypothetical protein
VAAEIARRRLSDAVPALERLCRRFAGFGVERPVPEQVAALDALGAISGPDAAKAVARLIAKGVVPGTRRWRQRYASPASLARSCRRRS